MKKKTAKNEEAFLAWNKSNRTLYGQFDYFDSVWFNIPHLFSALKLHWWTWTTSVTRSWRLSSTKCALLKVGVGFLLGNEVDSQSKLPWDEIFDEIVPGLTSLPVPALPSPNQKDRPDKAIKSGNRWPYSKSSNKIPLNPASSCVDLWDLNETSAKLKEQGWILSEGFIQIGQNH